MKRLFAPAVVALSFIVLLNGCIAIGTGPKSQQTNATLGQQLLDLKTAQANGAMTDAEYQTQKAKLLGNTPDSSPAK